MTGSTNPDDGRIPHGFHLPQHPGTYPQHQPHQPHPPQYPPPNSDYSGNDHLLNNEAAILERPIATSNDAMNLLEFGNQERNFQTNTRQFTSYGSPTTNFSKPSASGLRHQRNVSRNFSATSHPSPYTGSGAATERTMNQDQENEYRQAVQMWSRTRLVKDGWFTATEAMDYVD